MTLTLFPGLEGPKPKKQRRAGKGESLRIQGEHVVTSESYNDSHYTLPWVYSPLGPFKTDPCSGGKSIAEINYDIRLGQNGLLLKWFGLVWCNPPFSLKMLFLKRMKKHGNGFVLLPDSTSAIWWQMAANDCTCFLLFQGRIEFLDKDGGDQKGNTKGSTLFAYGQEAADRLKKAVMEGKLKGRICPGGPSF